MIGRDSETKCNTVATWPYGCPSSGWVPWRATLLNTIFFFSHRTEEMFLHLKEMNEKVFYIKDSLISLDSQLGHLQDLSALTVDTLKVISAVDTLQVEEALIQDQKTLSWKKIPHSWSNVPCSENNKQSNYYSIPSSLLRTLAKNQWLSKCHDPSKQPCSFPLENLKTKDSETESDTVTSGVSSESKSAPQYGNFLLVPSSPVGKSYSDEPVVDFYIPDVIESDETDFKDCETKDNICIPLTDLNVCGQVDSETDDTQAPNKVELKLPEISKVEQHNVDSVGEKPLGCSASEGGFVNWAFSEEGEVGVFNGGKNQKRCIHPNHSNDCQCLNNFDQTNYVKDTNIHSYSSGKNIPTDDQQQSTSFWVNPLHMNWNFRKSQKAKKDGKTNTIKGISFYL